MTFAIVFGVILYRITIKSVLHVSSYPAARANIRATVKTTAAIINLIAIIIMDEIYAAIARWLTRLGTLASGQHGEISFFLVPREFRAAGTTKTTIIL